MSWLAAHWDRATPLSWLLLPVTIVFRAAVALRRAAYRTGLARVHRLPVPLVVVGNITAGGTGKTPVVLWLAEFLRGRGHLPGIVSRGYGGTHAAPHRVMADSDPNAFGDEAVLLAQRSGCDVWIGADRVAAARALLEANRGCDVLIGDDGLQHYRLGRDIEICVLDGVRGFGNGWMLPAGPLREPPSRLASVDALVVNGGAPGTAAHHSAIARISPERRFRMTLDGREFYNLLNPGQRAGAARFHGQRVHAIAGIGDPLRFFRHLGSLGLEFVPHAFPDHHRYRARDIAYPDADAIVMTEKDAVKCRAFGSETHWVLPVDAFIDERFGAFVETRLQTWRPPAR